MPQSIEQRARFDHVRYANCWEDADVLTRALRPASGRRMLSIASAGDNSFALLAAGAEVVAVDLSPAQLALVEFKAATIRRLDRPDALGLLGVRPHDQRLTLFRAIEDDLSEGAREFWREHHEWIERGVNECGKFERFFRVFRRWVLPWAHDRRRIRELLREKDAPTRRAFYDRTWDTWRWRGLFRLFFSRLVMGRLGRDPEFFRYVQGEVAPRIRERVEYALTELPTHTNPYLDAILEGGYPRQLPSYLREDTWDALRRNLDALTLRQGTIDSVAADSTGSAAFDGFNLSDIFEYLDEAMSAEVYGRLLAGARPGARLAYWNMLVPREVPAVHADRIRCHPEEADALLRADRAFFYSRFVLEEVK